jgi:hypothetical protein
MRMSGGDVPHNPTNYFQPHRAGEDRGLQVARIFPNHNHKRKRPWRVLAGDPSPDTLPARIMHGRPPDGQETASEGWAKGWAKVWHPVLPRNAILGVTGCRGAGFECAHAPAAAGKGTPEPDPPRCLPNCEFFLIPGAKS